VSFTVSVFVHLLVNLVSVDVVCIFIFKLYFRAALCVEKCDDLIFVFGYFVQPLLFYQLFCIVSLRAWSAALSFGFTTFPAVTTFHICWRAVFFASSAL